MRQVERERLAQMEDKEREAERSRRREEAEQAFQSWLARKRAVSDPLLSRTNTLLLHRIPRRPMLLQERKLTRSRSAGRSNEAQEKKDKDPEEQKRRREEAEAAFQVCALYHYFAGTYHVAHRCLTYRLGSSVRRPRSASECGLLQACRYPDKKAFSFAFDFELRSSFLIFLSSTCVKVWL